MSKLCNCQYKQSLWRCFPTPARPIIRLFKKINHIQLIQRYWFSCIVLLITVKSFPCHFFSFCGSRQRELYLMWLHDRFFCRRIDRHIGSSIIFFVSAHTTCVCVCMYQTAKKQQNNLKIKKEWKTKNKNYDFCIFALNNREISFYGHQWEMHLYTVFHLS